MQNGGDRSSLRLVKRTQLLAAEDMEVQMMHRLPRKLAAVRHNTEAIGKAHLLGELRDDGVNVPDERRILLRDLRCGRSGGERREGEA